MPQAAARSSKRKVKPGRVPLRVEFPLAVWEQVSESRTRPDRFVQEKDVRLLQQQTAKGHATAFTTGQMID